MNEEKGPVIRFSVVILSVIISAVILFAFIPGFISSTVEYSDNENEGAGWLHFSYSDRARTYDLGITSDGDDLVIDQFGKTYTGPADDMIVYADSSASVVLQDGELYVIGNGVHYLGDNASVRRTNSGVRIASTELTDSITYGAPAWAYVPNKAGDFAFYPNDTHIERNEARPLASAGLFAGIGAYNGYVSVPDILELNADAGEDYINSVNWTVPVVESLGPITPFNPGVIPIHPVTPGIVSPLTADPGDFTAGDWTYNVSSGNATIITYIPGEEGLDAEGAVIPIPSSIGGYPVTAIGDGVGPVFSWNLYNYSFTIPEGVQYINSNAFNGIGEALGVMVIPDSVISIGARTFAYCYGLIGLVIEGSPSIAGDSFEGCEFSGVLNLGGGDWSDPANYGLASDMPVSDSIASIGYIADTGYFTEHYRTDTGAVLIRLIPLMLLIGLAVYFIHKINNRDRFDIGGFRK